jgi:hypothetical protein
MGKGLIAIVVALVMVIGLTIWSQFYWAEPQPRSISTTPRNDFLYGAVGAEDTPGLPYWAWLALPRMFPEYMPGPGGYAALGLSWEEGAEMPVGLAKKTVGYVRVTGNCALCHAASHSASQDDVPTVVITLHGVSSRVDRLRSFFTQCAQDTRFNADEILTEVDTATKLSFLDRMLYRYVLIPRTKRALLNPDRVLFNSALQQHARVPRSGFPQQRMQDLAGWLESNAQKSGEKPQ